MVNISVPFGRQDKVETGKAEQPPNDMFPSQPERLDLAEPRVSKVPDRPASEVAPRRSSTGITPATAVIGGIFVAVAIVAGAFYLQTILRDEVAPKIPMENVLASNVEADVTQPENVEAVVAAPVEGEASVHLRMGPNLTEDRRAEIMKILSDEGLENVQVENISFPIAVSRVGYYHEGDLTAASDLAEKISLFLASPTGPVPVRNYENLVPDASEGRLDLWIKE